MKRFGLILLAFLPSVQGAPFIMFAKTDPQVYPVLRQLLPRGDYAGFKISTQVPAIVREHQFVLPGGLDGVRKYAGCGAGTPGMVVYDIEHWSETPVVAPDGQYMGLKGGACTYDFEAGIYRSVDWTPVDLLSIQAQRMLSDTCAKTLTIADYTGFVSRVAAYVRSRNPSIVVVSQFSFRHTSPEKMVKAMAG